MRLRAESYVRAVERAWTAAQQRAVILSRREFTLLCDWYARGIPLEIVREAIEAAATRRARRPPRSLSYLAPAVEEAWRVVVQGRLDEGVPTTAPAGGEAAAAWRTARERLSPGSPLAALLDDSLRRLDAGSPPAEIDAALDGALPAAAPAPLVERLREQVERQTGAFHDRLDAERLERIRGRALVERLRARLGLPRAAG